MDPEDQVVRRRRFEAAHPEWKITSYDLGWRWRAEKDGEVIERGDLQWLLDALEKQDG